MYLKSIKAYGFKSFADKTEINFGENINGIVGPNGSGKSNVVDAVRWVLGEQSLKSLRGDVSTDVIFSGSKSRKPLNSASVTLIFDNSDMHLPTNYTEVSVKRVMYRTGENEYFLNNESCRLKDITNLFTDSGVDKESFNIISQGKIDEILSTKANDRRVIFESAAGVLKYKKRKNEALKKLERTNNNIDRVDDIIRELEVNLEPLKKQSEDAKEYLKLKQELKEVEVSLIVRDINSYNYEIKVAKDKIDSINDELASLNSNSSSYDIEILTKKNEVTKIEEEINEKQNLLLKCTKDIEKIDANIKVLKERKKYTEENDKILENILKIKENILKIGTDINNLEIDNNSNKDKLNKYVENKEVNDTEKDDLHEKKKIIDNEINKNNRKIVDLKYQIEGLERNINNNNLLPSAIKNILNNNRLEGYHNVIAKLISVDSEYSTCIDIALGAANNYLVVDTTNNAKELVKYLKDNRLGRATFYPLDAIKPKNIDEYTLSKIQSIPGFIDIASNLVESDSIYNNIILNRLGNVIVVKDIDSATNIGKIINNKYKIVSLDGQVINVGGSVTGGSINSKSNIIKERHELENLKLERQNLLSSNKDLEIRLDDINKKLIDIENNSYSIKSNISLMKETINKVEIEIQNKKDSQENLMRELKDLESISNNNSDEELENLLNIYYKNINNNDKLSKELEELKIKKQVVNDNINELERVNKQSTNYINNKEKEVSKLELSLNTMNIRMDNLLLTLTEEYNMTFESAFNNYELDIEEDLAREKVLELKSSLKKIDYVNIGAIEEYERVSKRYNFLVEQREDLHKAEDTLLEIINEMDEVMKKNFLTTFEEIRVEFKKVFREMFRGGEAELILTDPDNLLETGIEIQAVPSGKNLKSLSLLSGGEKTFTAISLLFAILNVRPVPFCLLDEVEAALDDANVESFGNYLYKYKNKTQFILITHKKKTMEFADILYGITMQESGVSKLVSVRLEDIKQ